MYPGHNLLMLGFLSSSAAHGRQQAEEPAEATEGPQVVLLRVVLLRHRPVSICVGEIHVDWPMAIRHENKPCGLYM